MEACDIKEARQNSSGGASNYGLRPSTSNEERNEAVIQKDDSMRGNLGDFHLEKREVFITGHSGNQQLCQPLADHFVNWPYSKHLLFVKAG